MASPRGLLPLPRQSDTRHGDTRHGDAASAAESAVDGGTRAPAVVDVLFKVVLVAVLGYAATHTELDRFGDKAMGLRAVLYPLIALLIPVGWWLFGRRRIPYPFTIDILVVSPFLLDTLGNLFNLYDSMTWFDDLMHFLNWVLWVTAFGLALRYRPLGRLNVAALTVGFGAVTNIVWEIGEYFSFITDNQNELRGIYRDTIGDMTLSLLGAVVGAALVSTALWRLTPDRRPGATP